MIVEQFAPADRLYAEANIPNINIERKDNNVFHKSARTAAIFVVMALLLPMLAACGTGSLSGVTPTPVGSSTTCTTDIQVSTILPTPEGTTNQPAVPTPTIGTPPDAPAYAEINVKLQALRDMCLGGYIADLIQNLAMLDPILGGIDR